MTELKNTYSGGWIKTHRSILNHWLADDPRKLGWWLIMLLSVNREDKRVRIGSEFIECKRGQSLMSLQSWAEKFKIKGEPETQKTIVRRFFNELKSDTMIVTEMKRRTTLLTICNYATYQDFEIKDETIVKLICNESETILSPKLRNKEDKNIKRSTNVDPKREETEILDLVNTEDQDPPVAPTPPAKKETDEEKFLRGFIHYCPSLPKPKSLTKERKTKIKLRLTEMGSFDTLREVLEKMEASDFLTGREGDWRANIDWLITNDKNWIKIIEGNYDNKTNNSNSENNGTKSKLQSTCRLGVSSDYSADESSL